MSEVERMVSANVQIRVAGQHPDSIGLFKFFVLPRIGELIHVGHGEDERVLRVLSVNHAGYSYEESTFDVGSTLLTCEQVH